MSTKNIPKILHQIWIGPKPAPHKWLETWKNMHPDWEYILWDESSINELLLVNRSKYEYCYKLQRFEGCTDIARIEILYKYGGIYVDADMICLQPLDNLTETDFFGVYSANIAGRVANGVIGCSESHPIINSYIKEVENAKKIIPPWSTIGAPLFKKVISYHDRMDSILPAPTFFPFNKKNQKTSVNNFTNDDNQNVYAEHYWLSKERSLSRKSSFKKIIKKLFKKIGII